MTAAGARARRVASGVAFLGVVAVAPILIMEPPGGPGPLSGPASSSGPVPVTATATVTGAASTSTGPTPTGPTSTGPTPTGPTPTSRTPTTGASPSTLTTPVLPRPVGTPTRTQYQEFLSSCGPNGPGRAATGTTAVTSVVYFGTPAGPDGTTRGATSCATAADRSSYWAPVLQVAGRAVDPTLAEVYYKSPVRDYRSVQPFPTGLRISAGGLAPVAAAGWTGAWSCGGERSPRLPDSCPAGAKLVVRLQTPGCWDGVRLDSADHRSHLSYPVGDRCPGGHPVAVPMIEFKVIYPVPAGALAATLSTGPGETFGMGFVNGWQSAALADLVTRCIDAGRRCGLTAS